jgi:hypothetical protein
MKKKIIFLSLATVLSMISSCKKNGLGGDATLVVFMKHHGRVITNKVGYPDTIYVKFNATDLPGIKPENFDTYFVGEVGEDHIHCTGLLPGKYYLYGVGMDSTGPYRVRGGMGIKIKRSERKKEIDTDLAVTE